MPTLLKSFFSKPAPTAASEEPFANVNPNLYDYLRTGEVPSGFRASEGRPEILLSASSDIDLDELGQHMWIRNVFDAELGYFIQGFVNTAKDLAFISTMSSVLQVTANQRIQLNKLPEGPVTDQFRAREIMSLNEVMDTYPDFNGTDIVIGIADTGTDFGVTDLSTAYATWDHDSNPATPEVPSSYDPGGTGLAITSFALPARRRGGGAGDYLLTAGLDFTMFRGDDGAVRMSSIYGVEPEDMKVGGYGGIVSQSGLYQVGMSVQICDGLPLGRALFVYILVDETTAGVYDTLYIDFETSWALTAAYNDISTWVTADWDFTNNDPHRWGDGTEVLASDLDFDGANDVSMGMLSTTYDYFDILTGDLISGILPDGSGFALMNDPDGHGTGTAGAAAGRGLTPFDVYGNGTLYTVTGAAPGAKIMALKLFTFGDYMNTWFWGCGFSPVTAPYNRYSRWSYTGQHKADIISNSWGFIDFAMTGILPIPWGYDWQSWAVDFFTWKTDTLFCISTGNAGPGYGTSGSPFGVSAMMVGASTTSHWAQPLYGNYSQGYDTMADFSSSGPSPYGAGLPSVVAIGAAAFDVYALHYGAGNGLDAWTTFGGTSQACPLAAGVTAIVLQAMHYSGLAQSGVYNSSIAKTIVMNGADDLGYDVYRQGAGRVNAWKAINLAFLNVTDGTNPLVFLGTLNTFEDVCGIYSNTLNRMRPARAFNNAIYRGKSGSYPGPFNSAKQYHPGSDAGVYGIWDGAAFAKPVFRGGSTAFNVTAMEGYGVGGSVDSLTAYTYDFWNESSALLTSTSTYTTFNLTAEFDPIFMSQFMAADYATILLTYPIENLEAIYALASMAPYVFLHDWMNDTNGNGIIDLTSFGVAGEVRRIASDTSYSNCHQINLGNPGSLFLKTPALYYHDVGVEFFLWRQLDVNVTIRLYNREPWTWVSTTQDTTYNWTVTVATPASATPGCYEGYLEASLGSGVAMMPVSVRVDAYLGDAGPTGAVSWGGSQDTPYDNGATYGGIDYGGRQAAGDWRYYFFDGYDNFTSPPSYVMVNVTWSDPDTRLDVYVWLSWYGYIEATSDFLYTGGHWQGTSTWTRQNVLLIALGDTGAFSWFLISGIGMAIRTSAFGGHTGGPEDFWVTVSYGYENHPDDVPTWGTPAVWMNVTRPTSYLGAAIRNDTTYTGPHVTFKANWSQLVLSEFPGIGIRQTRLELLSVVSQTHYGNLTQNQLGGWHPDTNPREGYDYVNLLAGQNVHVEVLFGSWVDPSDPTKGITPGGSDDCDIMIWAPGAANTYANSLTGAVTASGANPEAGDFIAPASGTYTIGIDWYSGVWPMAWSCYVYAFQAAGVTTDGLTSSMDTISTNTNAQYDVRASFITGTSLDGGAIINNFVSVPRVTVTNFFAPTVAVTSPNGGESFKRENPITITWTASDANVPDETLGFSVEVSRDNGVTWKVVVFGTTLLTATWNPSSAYYGLAAGNQFRVRVNVTDGRYTASDTSDATFTITEVPPTTAPPWELYTVIIVAVVVVVILLATCLLKRRQTPAK